MNVNFVTEFAYMRKVTTKVDVFSFGVIMMEFSLEKKPTELTEGDGIHITLPQLIEQAISKGVNELIEVVDPDLASVLITYKRCAFWFMLTLVDQLIIVHHYLLKSRLKQ
ncbi:putative non-specific serine/threonine protein kinase [Helianthus debilis subsp. tardiflorus]